MNKNDIFDILKQCKLILDCVDNSQMSYGDANRINFLVNNIRTIIYCESDFFKDLPSFNELRLALQEQQKIEREVYKND